MRRYIFHLRQNMRIKPSQCNDDVSCGQIFLLLCYIAHGYKTKLGKMQHEIYTHTCIYIYNDSDTIMYINVKNTFTRQSYIMNISRLKIKILYSLCLS
jgi:hypothetical protein